MSPRCPLFVVKHMLTFRYGVALPIPRIQTKSSVFCFYKLDFVSQEPKGDEKPFGSLGEKACARSVSVERVARIFRLFFFAIPHTTKSKYRSAQEEQRRKKIKNFCCSFFFLLFGLRRKNCKLKQAKRREML
jgi:hypothetical protein